MKKQKIVKVKIFEEYVYDGNSLDDFILSLEQAKEESNTQGLTDVKIEFGTERNFDSATSYIIVFGYRLETDKEEKDREKQEAKVRESVLAAERRDFERLKEKFEGKGAKGKRRT